ncbi:hypothetical protein K2173_020663 [Erythroxylum novogranatense]|uniref:TPX2 C-terminal domain-containing protein n=1 Tax=Erythroxylum novogranatense TaxID=1862640 RepID=A0AAV8TNF8_9ROSI|nr:hypothetical protein K2173_020663 [Erythroxylum novogranatense]
MGETSCLMRPFSYAAGFSSIDASEGKSVHALGQSVHALGQSVSFGRFTSESLSWEKWSTFSHNKYVEEAEKFSRPGSVAQMKAFFEAHYKNLAARKAAALLEQANSAVSNAPEPEIKTEVRDTSTPDSDANSESTKVREVDSSIKSQVLVGNSVKVEPSSQVEVVDNREEVKQMDLSGSKQTEKPLLKDFISSKDDSASMSKKKLSVSSSKSSIRGKAAKLQLSPAKQAPALRPKKENISTPTPINKNSAISTQTLMNFTPVRQLNRITSTLIRKIDSTSVSSNYKESKDCSTPLRTPTKTSLIKERKKQPIVTPLSENRRATTPLQTSACGSKTGRPKWNFFPTDCSKFMSGSRNKSHSPKISTPFNLRTEERAARKKEKLEEKFNVDQAQKVQLQATLKEKAKKELKRSCQSLCFKARPLPKFYKERAVSSKQIETVPLTQFCSPEQGGKSYPTAMQNTSPQLLQRPSVKTSGSKQAMEKNSHKPHSLSSHLKRHAHENISPNIQCK